MRIRMHNNQNGMIMVLAMFMMALLSMIGVASMMTSTTDIEIATGERQLAETFYRSQSSHTIAGEVLQFAMWDRGLGKKETIDTDGIKVEDFYDTIDIDGNPAFFEDIDDYTFAFRLLDPDILLEPEDSVSKTTPAGKNLKVWQADDQVVDELPCPNQYSDAECTALNAKIGSEDLDLWTDIRLIGLSDGQEVIISDVDVDKVSTQAMAGGGAEFGAKDLGIGSQVAIITYNIDARARISTGAFNRSPSRQALGFRIIK